MAKLLGYWDAANCWNVPVWLECYMPCDRTYVAKCKLVRIESESLVFIEDDGYGRSCSISDYNYDEIFGWRPWDSMPRTKKGRL